MNERAETVHQELVIKDRKQLTLDGVINVLDFSPETMMLNTSNGTVVIEGKDMKIENLSKEEGRILVCGEIEGFFFKNLTEKTGFFSKLFK